jgi:hypothetical protein
LVIQDKLSGTDAKEDIFFCLDCRSLDFAGSGLHQSKRLAIEGLLLGDSESSLSYGRLFQLVKCDAKGSAVKPQEPLNPFSPFGFHLSSNAFRHQKSNQISPAARSVGVAVGRIDFPRDETPGANLTHPVSLSLGVSSSRTSNAFKFVYDMRFRRRDVPGERGVSKGLRVFSRQAHVMTTRKA